MEKAKTSRLLLIFAVVCVACALVFSFAAASSAKEQVTSADAQLESATSSAASVYRLYNQYTGEHFYTLSKEENDSLVNVGWTAEGATWQAPKTSDTPVYRLYNPYTSDHHYTKDKNEYNTLGEIGWTQEGVAFHSDDAKGVAIFRVYNPYVEVGAHHFTSDTMEYRTLASIGWTPESVAFYGVDPNAGDPLPEESIKLDIEEVTFDGEAKTPKVTIEGLTEGTDFEVVYPEDMTNAGEKTITIKGIGKYAGTVTKTFTIAPKPLTDEELSTLAIDAKADVTYDGAEKKPAITGTILEGLKEGTDYEVTYENATNVSTEGNPAKATIKFRGNYSGEKTIEFEVKPLELTAQNVQMSMKTALTYDGTEQTQELASISVGNLQLTEADYTISGNTGKEAGNYTMTIEGTGNFSGSFNVDFTIAAKPVTEEQLNTLSVDTSVEIVYDGSEKNPAIKGSILDDFTEGVDYTIAYENATNAGTASATIEFTGNYSGKKTLNFTINKATPTVTFTDGATADSPVTVDQDEENSDAGISNFVCLNDDSDTDTDKVHPAFTVKVGDKDVAGTLSFTAGEGDDFTITAAKEAAAYGVTFTPDDGDNYKTVIGKGSSATAPVVYVGVEEATSTSTYLLASTSLMTTSAVASYSDSNNNPVNALKKAEERGVALDAAVKAAADSDDSMTYISAKELKTDIKTMKSEIKAGKTTSDANTTLKKYFDMMTADDVHLYTTYGSSVEDWADESSGASYKKDDGFYWDTTSAKEVDANKYVEFRIIEVGSHIYNSSNATDGSTLTFQATHELPRAFQIGTKMDTTDIQDYKWHNFTGDSCTNAGGWASSVLRTALQEKGWLYQKFSSTFTSAISKTKKSSQNGTGQGTSCTETSDDFFILSAGELSGSNNSIGPNYGLEGNQYSYWSKKGITSSKSSILVMKTRAGNSFLGLGYQGDAYNDKDWWERSANLSFASNFMAVDGDGNPCNDYIATNAIGVVPAFSF